MLRHGAPCFGSLVRLIVGGLWLAAGLIKLPHPESSVTAVRAYQLLPRGLSIGCGCFGNGGSDANAASKYPWEIARDVALLLASAYLVALPRTCLALDGWLFPARQALQAPQES